MCQPKTMRISRKVLLLLTYEKTRIERHQRYLMLMLMRSSIRTRNYITALSLDQPEQSAWQTLYRHAGQQDGGEGAFILCTGLDLAGFEELLEVFVNEYVVLSGPGLPGRPPKIADKSTVLGLILHFYVGTMEDKTLSELFGIPPSTLSRVKSNAEQALYVSLRKLKKAFIIWPSFDEQRAWARSVAVKEPLVTDKWGFIDGKNFKV
jgi:hypothetical protein